MQAVVECTKDLVLVGGGHAHALALRMLAMQPPAGVRITLISPASHTPYSGMLPGLVAGHYNFEQTHIDLSRLCQWAGVRFLAAEVTAVDPERQLLSLAGRPEIEYDLLSLDVGSEPELDSVPGARDHATPIKPVAGLWQRWSQLTTEGTKAPGRRVSVVGGGAGSVELILAMAQYFRDQDMKFTLLCGAPHILAGYNSSARKAVTRALAGWDIKLQLGARVISVEQGAVQLENGGNCEHDELFWCTGAAAAPWVADSGMQTDDKGFLAVRDTLQAMAYDNVFAAGDVATQVAHPRPKAGVYAVRQGPVLAENLRNALLGKPLRVHRPQRRFLSLLSLGDKKATADRGIFSATGAWVWRWKDRIDREFMSRFEQLPAAMPPSQEQTPVGLVPVQMPCGGCGAKLGADSLSRVLTRLAQQYPDSCPNGGKADDAAQISAPEGGVLLQSVDVLREIVSDPWLMGRISANHALSDIYASGAKPESALATVTLPFASASLQERELQQLLSGALHEFRQANCQLLGGHSLQGQELNIGFVVNGTPWSERRGPLGKTGLRVGDRLVLTKPLGTGALFARHMLVDADGRDVQAAINQMLASNAPASRLAVDHDVSAATDVTGFGLLGHLLEMLAPDQGARLFGADIPALAGALDALEAGVHSTMHQANALAKTAIGECAPGLPAALVDLLVDPQTSGGLLLGVASDRAEQFCQALAEAGCSEVALIGEVVGNSGRQKVSLR